MAELYVTIEAKGLSKVTKDLDTLRRGMQTVTSNAGTVAKALASIRGPGSLNIGTGVGGTGTVSTGGGFSSNGTNGIIGAQAVT